MIGISLVYSAISTFLESHHKASNHPIMSKLSCHFYLQFPCLHKWFAPWDLKYLFP